MAHVRSNLPRVPRGTLLGVIVLSLLLLGACQGSQDERAPGIIHRLLLAAQGDNAGTLESFPGALPDDLPAAVPLYPGAELIVSSRQAAFNAAGDLEVPEGPEPQQTLLYFIVLDTGDGRRDVFAFYEEAFDRDPWQLESTTSTAEVDTLEFSKVDDADISGVVAVVRGREDERTSILISLQDAGATREEPPFELGQDVPVPSAFPSDVPLYPGATVFNSAFFQAPQEEDVLVILLTTDGQDEVIAFYRDAFEQRGWTVEEDGVVFGLEDVITFADAAGDLLGEVRADRFGPDRRYTEVTIRIQQRPGRTPEDEITPAPTQAPATPSTPEERGPVGALR